MKIRSLRAFALAALLVVSSDALTLHRLFRDHMIVQRDHPVIVSGAAQPGASLEVSLQRAGTMFREQVSADSTGLWKVSLGPVTLGAPWELHVRADGEELKVSDMVAGDVWLLSGQSNMEWKIRDGVTGPDSEAHAEKYPGIRYFAVEKRCSNVAERDLTSGEWQVCSPETVGGFSAVGYYFARRVSAETGIPIGLIECNWGGSSIEAWMSPDLLAGLPHSQGTVIPEVDRGEITLFEAGNLSESRAGKLVELIENSFEGLKVGAAALDFDDSGWAASPFPKVADLPREILWLRRTFDWSGSGPAKLDLGFPHERVVVYVNGKEVARFQNQPVQVALDAGVLHKGRNVIALRLANPWWFPYIDGVTEHFGISGAESGSFVSLAGDWRLSTSLEPKLPVLWGMQQVNSALFNGMLSPLTDFGIKGVLWYQGETNADSPVQYATLFPAMIQDWRIRFKQGYFPFYFVQLANFGEPRETVEDRSLGHIRQAQAAALTLPRTGMALAIDVGEAYDIHPKNKVAVGERLARHALRNEYGKKLTAGSPEMREVMISGAQVRVAFTTESGLKTTDGAAPRCFSLAGSDGVYHLAEARIDGNTIVLSSKEVPEPKTVRYAWAGNPTVNLADGEGLPVVPFRTDSLPAPY
ncbi:MAG: sialate O-acetylesterase [Opitutaceae bacterium]|nr:sialate O-acetylesterase [Opitutaceae bacterium]